MDSRVGGGRFPLSLEQVEFTAGQINGESGQQLHRECVQWLIVDYSSKGGFPGDPANPGRVHPHPVQVGCCFEAAETEPLRACRLWPETPVPGSPKL